MPVVPKAVPPQADKLHATPFVYTYTDSGEYMGPEGFRRLAIGYIAFMLIAMGIMSAILISRFHLFGF